MLIYSHETFHPHIHWQQQQHLTHKSDNLMKNVMSFSCALEFSLESFRVKRHKDAFKSKFR